LKCFSLTPNYKKIVREEIAYLCEYGIGFNFDICYNLPVSERKLQILLLNNKLKLKHENDDSEVDDGFTFNENTPINKIQKFNKGFNKKSEKFTYRPKKK